MFVDTEPDEDGNLIENYILSERLGIAIKLNQIFMRNQQFIADHRYWSLIHRGLYDQCNISRK